jgi:hypothetical protein
MTDIRKITLISALLLAASPVAAQVATLNGQQQPGVQVPAAPSRTPTTGVICDEEATATFCNVPTGRTRVATNRVADQHRAAVLEAPRRRRPSRLAGRNGRPTNYATNQIPARRLTGGKPRGTTLDGHSTPATRGRRAPGATKRNPTSVTAEYRIVGTNVSANDQVCH